MLCNVSPPRRFYSFVSNRWRARLACRWLLSATMAMVQFLAAINNPRSFHIFFFSCSLPWFFSQVTSFAKCLCVDFSASVVFVATVVRRSRDIVLIFLSHCVCVCVRLVREFYAIESNKSALSLRHLSLSLAPIARTQNNERTEKAPKQWNANHTVYFSSLK